MANEEISNENTQNSDPKQKSTDVSPSGKKKLSSTQILLMVLIVVVLIIGAIIIAILLKPKATEDEKNRIVTEENADTIGDELKNKVADGMYEVNMNTIWNFNSSSLTSTDAYIANAETNRYTVYFDILIDGTGETVFTSPYIAVGSRIQNLTLNKQLAAGSYTGTCVYHLVDEYGEEISSVAVAISFNVLN